MKKKLPEKEATDQKITRPNPEINKIEVINKWHEGLNADSEHNSLNHLIVFPIKIPFCLCFFSPFSFPQKS
jgi:hypothetical protein